MFDVYVLEYIRRFDKKVDYLFREKLWELVDVVLRMVVDAVLEEARYLLNAPGVRGKVALKSDLNRLFELEEADRLDEFLVLAKDVASRAREAGMLYFSHGWEEVVDKALKLLRTGDSSTAMILVDQIKDIARLTGMVLPELSRIAKEMEGKRISKVVRDCSDEVKRVYGKLRLVFPEVRVAQLRIEKPSDFGKEEREERVIPGVKPMRLVDIKRCIMEVTSCLDSLLPVSGFELSRSEDEGGNPTEFAGIFTHFWYCCNAVLTLFEEISFKPGMLSAVDAGAFRDAVVRYWEHFLEERIKSFDSKIRVLWARWQVGGRKITDFASFLKNYPYSHLWDWVKAAAESRCCDCVKEMLRVPVRRDMDLDRYRDRLRRVFAVLTVLKKGPRVVGEVLQRLAFIEFNLGSGYVEAD